MPNAQSSVSLSAGVSPSGRVSSPDVCSSRVGRRVPATERRRADIGRVSRGVALSGVVALAGAALAAPLHAATSDRLVVLGADGRSRLVQHVLTSEGAIVRLALPDDAEAALVRFAGPERATFAEARRRSPAHVALWSGSALVRYRDERTLEPDASGTFRERLPAVPGGLSVADGVLAVSRLTWVFPETLEVVSFDGGDGGNDGRWTLADGVLVHEQPGGEPGTLEIAWRRRGEDPIVEPAAGPTAEPVAGPAAELPDGTASALPCPDASAVGVRGARPGPGESCTGEVESLAAVDVDADGIPDLRDVCLDPFGDGDDPASVDRFGCESVARTDGRDVLVVDGIEFPAGKSYLDGDARAVLDRLARALTVEDDGTLHEIAAHTDGAGSRARNLRLSERRAEAVRHYLMLRGVGPNRLRARGHGEGAPRADDRTAVGRRANRRIELERLETR